MAILEEIGGFLKSGSNLSDLADYLGTGVEDVKRPVGAAVSLLVAAVAKRSGTETGASALFDTVKSAGGAALEHVGAPFGREEQVHVGEQLIDALLGGRREQIEEGLSQKSGMSLDQIQDLLPAMAPPVMAAMGRRVSRERMGRSALLGELESDRSTMEREGLSSLLGLLDGGDDESDAFHFAEVMNRFNSSGGMQTVLPAARPVQRTGENEAVYTSISTTPDLSGGAGEVPIGGASVYEDAATSAAAAAAEGGGDNLAAGAAVGAAGVGAAGVGAAGVATATRDTGTLGGDDEFYGRPADKRWMWVLGGVLALLLLILLIWQCGGDGDDNGATTEPTLSADTGGDDTGDTGSETPDPPSTELKDNFILKTAQEKGSFNEFLAAVEFAGLTETLEQAEPALTVFAPTDDAFAQLDPALRSDPVAMREILSYHVVEGVLQASQLQPGEQNTQANLPILVETSDGNVRLNGANVTLADQQAVNGVFHVVDQVLIPPGMATGPGAGQTLNEVLGLAQITFEPGSAIVTAEGLAELDKLAAFLVDSPTAIEVQGYTDNTGDADINLSLSQQRADAARTYLVDSGVDAELLSAVGYGIENPVQSNDTAEGQAANRRIEFLVK